jgi:hypothetical protein
MVYPNHIKRISAYIIKSLVHTEVLKNITLPFLILQVLIKGYMPNWGLLLALFCNPKKYSNLTPNFNLRQLTWLTRLTNTIITGLIEYIVDVVGNTVKGIINIDYKAIVEVLIEVHFKVITRRNIMFVKSQIAS